jgi:hypothetical protein
MTDSARPGSGNAKEGEKVWGVLNRVKADKLDVHRNFVYDLLMPAVQKVAPEGLASVRFLEAANPNEDGTYTTVWIMDPVIESVDYSYDSLLIAAYGAEQGAEYLKLVDEYSLSEQEGYDFRQSKW